MTEAKHYNCGGRNGRAKLTLSNVIEIRRRDREEPNYWGRQSEWAQEFSVDRATINKVIKEARWKL